MQIELDERLTVRRFTWDIIDSNSYLIISDNKGLLIDAVDSPELYQAVGAMDDLTVILTHCHFDHICGLNEIRKRSGGSMCVYCTEKCSDKIGKIFKNMSSTANVFITFFSHGERQGNYIQPFVCAPADTTFTERKTLWWNENKIELIPTYGHTDDGAIIILNERWLFSGDTLLPFPTTTRFPSGNKDLFWNSDIPCLENKATQIQCVFPGHGDPGMIGAMIAQNKR